MFVEVCSMPRTPDIFFLKGGLQINTMVLSAFAFRWRTRPSLIELIMGNNLDGQVATFKGICGPMLLWNLWVF